MQNIFVYSHSKVHATNFRPYIRTAQEPLVKHRASKSQPYSYNFSSGYYNVHSPIGVSALPFYIFALSIGHQ